MFYEPSVPALLAAVQAALETYQDHSTWRRMMQNAMDKDFSWQQSARQYLDLYGHAIALKQGIAVSQTV
jgi:starch synthase